MSAATTLSLLVTLVIVALHLVDAAVVSYPRPLTASSAQSDAVTSLISRYLPKDVAEQFSVEIIPLPSSGHDIFQVDNNPNGGIILRGTTGVAAASAFNYYMKYVTLSHMSWGKPSSDGKWDGDNITLVPGSKLDKVDQLISIQFNVNVRYSWNVCTYGYTAPFWGWSRWEREIDWLAMNGVNYPLAFEGQEYIFAQVFASIGLSESDLEDHFAGPAFLPWNRMGNMRGWGGPINSDFRKRRFDLQKLIIGRMTAFGMIPVLGGFSGVVPKAILKLTNNATRLPEWSNMGDAYSGDYLLNPSDPLFLKIGRGIVSVTHEQIGSFVRVFNADTFNEMAPASGDLDYLSSWGKAVYDGMSDDPNAVWMLQGWLFYNEKFFWTAERINAYLKPVPKNRLLILDLFSDNSPQFDRTNQYDGHPYVWNMLHNFGGNPGMYGKLDTLATEPFAALSATNSTMVGIGFTPEAIEQNYVLYEFILEMAWRKSPVDVDAWILAYQSRRYGSSASVETAVAWKIMRDTIYKDKNRLYIRMCRTPSLQTGVSADDTLSTKFISAWRLMSKSMIHLSNPTSPFVHDAVDMTREMMSMLFEDVRQTYSAIYTLFQSQHIDVKTAKSNLESLNGLTSSIIVALDEFLATNANFLLGPWISDARALAVTDKEAAQFEANARNILTLWGPGPGINDYAAKQWSGLLTDYYLGRFDLHYSYLEQSLTSPPTVFPETAYEKAQLLYEQSYTNQTNSYPTVPQGSTREKLIAITRNFGLSMDYWQESGYKVIINTDYNSNDIVKAWTKDPSQLAFLCDALPLCLGFNSNGYLKLKLASSSAVDNCQFYIKS